MFRYHLRLAWLSVRRRPALTALVAGAIAVGIGVCMTTLTMYFLTSGNPIPEKSERLFHVQMDNWDPNQAFYTSSEGDGPPFWLTWQDSQALLESDIPVRQAQIFRTAAVIESAIEGVAPQSYAIRTTTRDFFPMFDVPFLYGDAWSAGADADSERVIVLGRELNETLFGGEDSTGRDLRVGGRTFRVVGVIDDWNPLPKFYDVNAGMFSTSEEAFMPGRTAVTDEMELIGNTICWEAQQIESVEDFLNSDCIWITHWVELPDGATKAAFEDFLDAYVNEQKALGRFPRPLDNRVLDVMEWLEFRDVVGDDGRVMVVISFMFLTVCLLNAVGLLLAKFSGNSPLVAVRRALGASRGDILRQHLVEVGAVGAVGGLLGLGVAWLGLAFVRSGWDSLERVTRLDGSMLLVGIALAVACGLLAGLYPAWRVCRTAPVTHLKAQ